VSENEKYLLGLRGWYVGVANTYLNGLGLAGFWGKLCVRVLTKFDVCALISAHTCIHKKYE